MNEKQVSVSLLAIMMAMSVRAAEPVEGGNMPKAADVGGGGAALAASRRSGLGKQERRSMVL